MSSTSRTPAPSQSAGARHSADGGAAASAITIGLGSTEPLDESALGNLRHDLPAALVVFLVAIPLCLGIALASGAPLFSGIISGMVGGLLISRLSGSQLMVSGPAAGLTAIVIAALQTLGSFEAFLASVVIAGLLQILLGVLRAGIIGYFFPSAVIKGMLAAIGLILILKQIPHALGFAAAQMGDETFAQPNELNTFTAIPAALAQLHLGALIVSSLSLCLLVLWDRPALRRWRRVPGPLLAVLLGVALDALFRALAPGLALDESRRVSLPIAASLGEWLGLFTTPDWSALANPEVYRVAITIAIVASLESLLSLEATDKIDPFKREAPANRELFAQGVGNTLAGLIGGLPVTGVIVRSSVNIDAGARTRNSSFVHGALLLLAAFAFPALLNQIPLAALAAILIYTGYKLAHPRLLRVAYRIGWAHFLPFVVTIAAILLTDLLVGIAIGLAVGVFFVLRANYQTAYHLERDGSGPGAPLRIILSEETSFLNKASIASTLSELPPHSTVSIDGSRAKYIDYDVLELLNDFRETARLRDIKLRLIGVPLVETVPHH
jgi:MFS superfamily sulfate permease-like transporter